VWTSNPTHWNIYESAPLTVLLLPYLNTCSYSPYVTSSLTRGWVCRLQLLLGFARAVILRSESCGSHNHILQSQIRDSPNLQGQIPVFISPRNREAQLYPQALGSLFVASYDPQGYGWFSLNRTWSVELYSPGADPQKTPLASRKWMDSIEIDIRERGWDGMDWIDLAEDRD
jgi:hypothetical protein